MSQRLLSAARCLLASLASQTLICSDCVGGVGDGYFIMPVADLRRSSVRVHNPSINLAMVTPKPCAISFIFLKHGSFFPFSNSLK